jgi:hypothetical protein
MARRYRSHGESRNWTPQPGSPIVQLPQNKLARMLGALWFYSNRRMSTQFYMGALNMCLSRLDRLKDGLK